MREELRLTLGLLEKLTLRPAEVGPEDIAPLRAAGLSDEAIEDAIQICSHFNLFNRLADSLGFARYSAKSFRRHALMLLKAGYDP